MDRRTFLNATALGGGAALGSGHSHWESARPCQGERSRGLVYTPRSLQRGARAIGELVRRAT